MSLKLSQFKKQIPLTPYPLDQLDLPDLLPYHPDRYYTICMACRDLYVSTDDSSAQERIRYIATIAKAITDRLQAVDPEFFHSFYPRVKDYKTLMKEAHDVRD
jgi:hypothetical protein